MRASRSFWLKRAPEELARAQELDADRIGILAGHLRDLLVGQVVEKAKDEHYAISLRQAGQRGVHPRALLGGERSWLRLDAAREAGQRSVATAFQQPLAVASLSA